MTTHQRTMPLLAALLVVGTLHAQTPSAARTPSPATADAAKPQEPPKIDFTAIDKDANGQLSKEEAVTVTELEAAFDTLDANSDKAVTPTEFAKWPQAGKTTPVPRDSSTAPGGSAGAQHMPNTN